MEGGALRRRDHVGQRGAVQSIPVSRSSTLQSPGLSFLRSTSGHPGRCRREGVSQNKINWRAELCDAVIMWDNAEPCIQTARSGLRRGFVLGDCFEKFA